MILLLYHTILTFNHLEVKAFRKYYEERRKCCFLPHLSEQSSYEPLLMSSANPLNLDQSKILTFVKRSRIRSNEQYIYSFKKAVHCIFVLHIKLLFNQCFLIINPSLFSKIYHRKSDSFTEMFNF